LQSVLFSTSCYFWHYGAVGRALDFSWQVQSPAIPLSCNDAAIIRSVLKHTFVFIEQYKIGVMGFAKINGNLLGGLRLSSLAGYLPQELDISISSCSQYN